MGAQNCDSKVCTIKGVRAWSRIEAAGLFTLTACARWQVRELEARVEDAATAAARAAREAAAAVEAERSALAEARRENTVLAAAAGADKNSALAELKVRTPC